MKKRTKNKNKKTVSAIKRVKRTKSKHYESHYLLLALAGFLIVQGLLMTSTKAVDWEKGLAMLDVSTPVTQTISDAAVVLEPITNIFEDVDQFYKLATTEMTAILDLSGYDHMAPVTTIAGGIYEFYQEASTELATLLDFSSVSTWPETIAGASITR